MNCEQARRVILTDHMDGESGNDLRNEVDEHLRKCAACREIECLAREEISRPLNAAASEPPAYLWKGIRERISSEAETRSGFFTRSAEAVMNVFTSIARVPRPAMAFAVAAMIIMGFLISAPGAQRRALDEYLSEQALFVTNLDNGEVNGVNMFDTDISTGTERFM